MTVEEAAALIAEWQRRLRLQDWTITVEITEQREDCGGGKIRMLSKYKAAAMVLLDPAKIPADWLGCQDPEVTIVHELLHAQTEALNGFLDGKKRARYLHDMERFVELTAIALVTLKREMVSAMANQENSTR